MLKVYPVFAKKTDQIQEFKTRNSFIHDKIQPMLFFQSLSYTKQDKVKSSLYENVQLKTHFYIIFYELTITSDELSM